MTFKTKFCQNVHNFLNFYPGSLYWVLENVLKMRWNFVYLCQLHFALFLKNISFWNSKMFDWWCESLRNPHTVWVFKLPTNQSGQFCLTQARRFNFCPVGTNSVLPSLEVKASQLGGTILSNSQLNQPTLNHFGI